MAEKQKKVQVQVQPAYWCTCVDNPETCMGCAIDRLVLKVLGDIGLSWLKARTYNIIKKEKSK